MVVQLRHFGVLWLSLSVFALSKADGERLIARGDGARIIFRMIACTAEGSKECHAQEQQRLARRVQRLWVRAALKRYGITLTPEEEQVVARQTAATESHIQRTAARFHALDVAAVRARRGEERAGIDADLAKEGIAPHDLDMALEYVPTLADAERTAARDRVAEIRESVNESFREPFLLDHLRELVLRRAAAQKVSFDVAEQQFWSEISQITHTRIIDLAYTMPDRKGILVER
jgi:hypothetical protein